MRKEILEYIRTQRVGVLAVEMLDGSPHGATVHVAHTEEPLTLYMETDRNYRKSEALLGRPESRASFVFGFEEGASAKTLQIDGVISIITPEEIDNFNSVYFSKFPDKAKKLDNPDAVRFKLVPTWWRFTDWSGPNGKIIILSTDVNE